MEKELLIKILAQQAVIYKKLCKIESHFSGTKKFMSDKSFLDDLSKEAGEMAIYIRS
jgi:hypothetical protein